MKLDDAKRQGYVSLVKVGRMSHILANVWFPLEDENVVYEHTYFCGMRAVGAKLKIVDRAEFNETACRTCTRRYPLADILHRTRPNRKCAPSPSTFMIRRDC